MTTTSHGWTVFRHAYLTGQWFEAACDCGWRYPGQFATNETAAAVAYTHATGREPEPEPKARRGRGEQSEALFPASDFDRT